MTIPGRKPKPTKLKIIEGNPGKRPLNENEPIPQSIAPECPDWLSDDAKKEWKRLAPELERLGLLTVLDMAAFAGYCQSYAKLKKSMLKTYKSLRSRIWINSIFKGKNIFAKRNIR